MNSDCNLSAVDKSNADLRVVYNCKWFGHRLVIHIIQSSGVANERNRWTAWFDQHHARQPWTSIRNSTSIEKHSGALRNVGKWSRLRCPSTWNRDESNRNDWVNRITNVRTNLLVNYPEGCFIEAECNVAVNWRDGYCRGEGCWFELSISKEWRSKEWIVKLETSSSWLNRINDRLPVAPMKAHTVEHRGTIVNI